MWRTDFLARYLARHNAITSTQVVDAIQSARASVVLVSNEVGSGVVPAFKSGRLYRDVLGELNQQVARVASDVVLLVAGIPVVIKGRG